MLAIGLIVNLPRRLLNAGKKAFARKFAEMNTTYPELAHKTVFPAADKTAI